MAPTQLTEFYSAFFLLYHTIRKRARILGEYFKIKSPLNFFLETSAVFWAV